MNGYPGKGKIKGGRFSCCLWTTWNEPYGPLAHLFEKPADKGCAFTRGPCRSLKIARTCPKGVVLLFHEQPRVFQCGKVNSCFYENTQLRLNPCQLELRRFVVLFHLLFFKYTCHFRSTCHEKVQGDFSMVTFSLRDLESFHDRDSTRYLRSAARTYERLSNFVHPTYQRK